MRSRYFREQFGGALIEYAVALGILAVVFVVASFVLKQKANEHIDRSTEVVKGFTPCTDPKYGGQLDASKGECF